MRTSVEIGNSPINRGTVEVAAEFRGQTGQYGGNLRVVGLTLRVHGPSDLVISSLEARLIATALLAYADLEGRA